ncbi:MAG: hypothetical protein PUD34_00020 [bacterium]|nr:hypothetical protein [bacterium]
MNNEKQNKNTKAKNNNKKANNRNNPNYKNNNSPKIDKSKNKRTKKANSSNKTAPSINSELPKKKETKSVHNGNNQNINQEKKQNAEFKNVSKISAPPKEKQVKKTPQAKKTNQSNNSKKSPIKKKKATPKKEEKKITIITQEQPKDYEKELKDINNNQEMAKAIWNTTNINTAIQEEITNKEKLDKEINEMLTKQKKVSVIEPFIAIVFLIICFIAMYIILFTKDSSIVNSFLNNLLATSSQYLEVATNYKEDIKKGLAIEATLDTTNLEYSNLKDYSYNIDIVNKETNYFGTLYITKDTTGITTDFSFDNDNFYLKLPSYYYPIKIASPINLLNINYGNLYNNLEVIKNYLFNNFKYSKSNKEKVNINNTKLNVLNINLTEEETNNFINNTINDITNDKELMTSLAQNLNISAETINNYLKDNINVSGNYTIKIYTKGFRREIKGISILKNDDTILEYLNLDSKTLEFNFNNNHYSITKTDNKLVGYYNDIKIFDIKKNKVNNETRIEYQFSNIINNCQGSLYLKELDRDTKEIIFSIANTNNKEQNLSLTFNITHNPGDVISMDTTDAIDINDLTEDNFSDILASLMDIMWNNGSLNEIDMQENN